MATCNYCNGQDFFEGDGCVTCRKCGVVAEEGILIPDASWHENSMDYAMRFIEDEFMPTPVPKDKFHLQLSTVASQMLHLPDSYVQEAITKFQQYRESNLFYFTHGIPFRSEPTPRLKTAGLLGQLRSTSFLP